MLENLWLVHSENDFTFKFMTQFNAVFLWSLKRYLRPTSRVEQTSSHLQQGTAIAVLASPKWKVNNTISFYRNSSCDIFLLWNIIKKELINRINTTDCKRCMNKLQVNMFVRNMLSAESLNEKREEKKCRAQKWKHKRQAFQ